MRARYSLQLDPSQKSAGKARVRQAKPCRANAKGLGGLRARKKWSDTALSEKIETTSSIVVVTEQPCNLTPRAASELLPYLDVVDTDHVL